MEVSALSRVHGSQAAAAGEKAAAAGAKKALADQGPPAPEAPERARFDRFEEAGGAPPSAGVYSVEPDGEEGYRIAFRAPEDGKDPPAPEGGEEAAKPPERTTVNTDQVDAELRRLEQERSELERQLARQTGMEEPQAEALRRRLEAVETELAQKSTDAYRRSNASVTTE